MTLSEVDKKDLLLLARDSIVGIIESGRAKTQPVPHTGALHFLCGVFVSIYVKGKL